MEPPEKGTRILKTTRSPVKPGFELIPRMLRIISRQG
jgi:hypothetical protein